MRAVEIIGNGESNINAIARACGYNDSLYFGKVFKKIMHQSPREYINSRKIAWR